MASGKQALARRSKMAERAQKQREIHFPDVSDVLLWHRKKNDGFTTIPRTMPIVMQIIDSKSKGTPAGHTLFCLWARSFDNPLIIIENQSTFAAEAGFTGTRAVDTWRKRMKKLRELSMIETKEGSHGEFNYILLLNPNVIIEKMNRKKEIQKVLYSRFIDRLLSIGAYQDIENAKDYWDSDKETETEDNQAIKD